MRTLTWIIPFFLFFDVLWAGQVASLNSRTLTRAFETQLGQNLFRAITGKTLPPKGTHDSRSHKLFMAHFTQMRDSHDRDLARGVGRALVELSQDDVDIKISRYVEELMQQLSGKAPFFSHPPSFNELVQVELNVSVEVLVGFLNKFGIVSEEEIPLLIDILRELVEEYPSILEIKSMFENLTRVHPQYRPGSNIQEFLRVGIKFLSAFARDPARSSKSESSKAIRNIVGSIGQIFSWPSRDLEDLTQMMKKIINFSPNNLEEGMKIYTFLEAIKNSQGRRLFKAVTEKTLQTDSFVAFPKREYRIFMAHLRNIKGIGKKGLAKRIRNTMRQLSQRYPPYMGKKLSKSIDEIIDKLSRIRHLLPEIDEDALEEVGRLQRDYPFNNSRS